MQYYWIYIGLKKQLNYMFENDVLRNYSQKEVNCEGLGVNSYLKIQFVGQEKGNCDPNLYAIV